MRPALVAPARPTPRATVLAGLAVAALLPSTAGASDFGLSLGAGWRGGGAFVETASGASRQVEPSAVVSASLERAIDASRQVQLHLSVQDTAVTAGSTRLPLRITTLHLGGTNFFEGPIGRGPYVSGGLGATLIDPGLAGTSSEAFFSLAVGIGWLWPLTPSVALRAEARGTLVAVNAEGALFCSGGCVVSLRGDAFLQGDVQLGLAIRF
jgi:hypothetical protein